MKKEPSVSIGRTETVIAAIFVVGLYVISRYSYLAFHTLAELFSIVIGFGLFMLTWNLRRIIDNNYLLFIGIAYLFVSGIDLAHTFSYKGIDVFAGRYGMGLNTQFWIAARYLESLALFTSPFFFSRKLRTNATLAAFALVTAALFASIFLRIFPVCYVEGVGLTRFKIVSEYVISFILLCSLLLLLKKREEFDRGVLTLLVLSIIATIGSELAFTFYVGFGDFSNLVGHFLKVLSFYLIYKAVIEIGLSKPYDLLFRNLKLREKDLGEQSEWLRVTLTSIGDAVIATDASGLITFVNPVTESLTGWAGKDAVGRPVTEVFRIINEKTNEPGGSIVERVLRDGSAVTLANNTALICRDGSVIPIEDSAAPIKDSTGKVTGAVLVFHEVTQKRKAEKALRESEEKYRSLFENLNSAALLIEPICDSDGKLADFRYLMVNPSVEKHLGKAPDKMVGKLHSEVWHAGRNPVFDIYEEVLSSGEPFRGEIFLPATNRYFDMAVYRPIVGRLALVLSDVSQHKRAEEALRESERRLTGVLESMPDAFVSLDADMRYTYINANAERLQSARREELLGKDVRTVYPDEESYKTISQYEGVIREQKPVTLTSYHAGFGRWIEVRAFPTPDGVSVFYKDVSAQVKAERDLRESEERLRLLGDNLPESAVYQYVHELDGSASFLYFSAGIERLNGVTVADVVRDVGILHRQFLPEYVDQLVEAEARSKRDLSDFDMEIPMRRPDGTVRWMKLHSRPRRLPDGRTVWDGVQTDITERKFAEEELRRARDELELRVTERTSELQKAYSDLLEQTRQREQAESQLRQSQKMDAIGTLTGGIAHDFNNILAAVIGFTELAKEKLPTDSKEKRHLERVLQAGIRGRDLVRHMLTFARQTEQEKKPLSLSSVVKETTKLLRASFPSTVGIKTNIKSESGFVFADPVQVQQVIMNLCTNGAHAMRETGGILQVELSDFSVSLSEPDTNGIRPGLYVKLTVTDTGSGISPQIINKVFDPFFTTKKAGEGTGLGLSVVHGIVEQHEGYVTVESEPGRGSSFSVYLPKVAEEVPAESAAENIIPFGHEKVLFIDDEKALGEMGQELLEELGYQVTVKGNSMDALSVIRSDPSAFDLIITDQTMPEMTGVQLAKEILALRPDIPIILCTGFSHLVDANQAKAAGIKGFAMKPLTKREIARTIRQVLDE
jgi:PAS domain S-box-containing protein